MISSPTTDNQNSGRNARRDSGNAPPPIFEWQKRLVEIAQFNLKVSKVTKWLEEKQSKRNRRNSEPIQNHDEDPEIRIYIGFNPSRADSTTKGENSHLVVHTYSLGRKVGIDAAPYERLKLDRTQPSKYHQGLTVIVDDFRAVLPLTRSKDLVCFSRADITFQTNLQAWISSIIQFYWELCFSNLCPTARHPPRRHEVDRFTKAISETKEDLKRSVRKNVADIHCTFIEYPDFQNVASRCTGGLRVRASDRKRVQEVPGHPSNVRLRSTEREKVSMPSSQHSATMREQQRRETRSSVSTRGLPLLNESNDEEFLMDDPTQSVSQNEDSPSASYDTNSKQQEAAEPRTLSNRRRNSKDDTADTTLGIDNNSRHNNSRHTTLVRTTQILPRASNNTSIIPGSINYASNFVSDRPTNVTPCSPGRRTASPQKTVPPTQNDSTVCAVASRVIDFHDDDNDDDDDDDSDNEYPRPWRKQPHKENHRKEPNGGAQKTKSMQRKDKVDRVEFPAQPHQNGTVVEPANDQFQQRQTFERLLTEKKLIIRGLKREVSDLKGELATANARIASLESDKADMRRVLDRK